MFRRVGKIASLVFVTLGLLGAAAPARASDTVADVASASDDAAPGRIKPLTRREGLSEPQEEKAVRLQNARVVLADYPLIKKDFGKAIASHYGRPLEHVSHEEIDHWLLDSAAYVSQAQARQTTVNTQIHHTEKVVTALRPADYGRALVYEPKPGVLIDVKGAGSREPEARSHGNGLATLGESIREYAYEHLVHSVFQHAKTGEKTVGHYAVIDAGFDVKHAEGHTDRAGLILRQAHSRAPGILSALDNQDSKRVEMTLRKYGITSAGAYQDHPFDRVNIQGSKEGAILDFGAFLVMPKFDKAAYHFDRTRVDRQKYKPLLSMKKDFVQPDEAVRVPTHLWGYTVSGHADPQHDNPQRWSHELASALGDGRATRADAEQHMRNLMDPVKERLEAHPVSDPHAALQRVSVGKNAWRKSFVASKGSPSEATRSTAEKPIWAASDKTAPSRADRRKDAFSSSRPVSRTTMPYGRH